MAVMPTQTGEGKGELWTTLDLANYPGFLYEKAAPRERYKASTSGYSVLLGLFEGFI